MAGAQAYGRLLTGFGFVVTAVAALAGALSIVNGLQARDVLGSTTVAGGLGVIGGLLVLLIGLSVGAIVTWAGYVLQTLAAIHHQGSGPVGPAGRAGSPRSFSGVPLIDPPPPPFR